MRQGVSRAGSLGLACLGQSRRALGTHPMSCECSRCFEVPGRWWILVPQWGTRSHSKSSSDLWEVRTVGAWLGFSGCLDIWPCKGNTFKSIPWHLRASKVALW